MLRQRHTGDFPSDQNSLLGEYKSRKQERTATWPWAVLSMLVIVITLYMRLYFQNVEIARQLEVVENKTTQTIEGLQTELETSKAAVSEKTDLLDILKKQKSDFVAQLEKAKKKQKDYKAKIETLKHGQKTKDLLTQAAEKVKKYLHKVQEDRAEMALEEGYVEDSEDAHAWATEKESINTWIHKLEWCESNIPAMTRAQSVEKSNYRAKEKTEQGGHFDPDMGEKLNERYQVKFADGVSTDRGVPSGALGKGHFSVVWLGEDKSETAEFKDVAIKILRNTKSVVDTAHAEIDILEDTKTCKNSVTLIDHFQIPKKREDGEDFHEALVFPVLGSDVCVFQDRLEDRFKTRAMPVAWVKKIARNILEFYADLHKLDMIHTDLKPENVFMFKNVTLNECPPELNDYQNEQIISRVGDLGNAERLRDGYRKHHSVITTRYYRAPETLLRMPEGTPSDIWALGCMVFELLSGNILFGEKNEGNTHHLHQFVEVLRNGDHFPVEDFSGDSAWTKFQNGEWTDDGMSVFQNHFNKITGKWKAPENKPVKKWDIRSEYPKEMPTGSEQCTLLDEFLLDCILLWDPAKRWTAEQLLEHKWLEITPEEEARVAEFFAKAPTPKNK